MRKLFTAASCVVLLSGCAAGIASNSPSIEFKAPVNYQEAYRRADAAARKCHITSGPWTSSPVISGNLYHDIKGGELRVTTTSAGKEVLHIEIRSEGESQSSVKATAMGGQLWDQQELEAVRTSIETGSPTCRASKYR